ncbi:hypothetical protein C5167_048217 [Papaver somniferum]|uniref:Uncharacterized protein n=1 Tax=Papaver somniferum TaxID=3469 RepID=A0A4Y7KKM9_PAPSO|nr:cyclin-dependent protein kinase inhibitor SMR6-like [Papaver somniferum]RZC72741.1 hypothetical protein C5167_048217 [Papaver somniferum]
MGLSMKSQVLAEGKETEGNKKWVVAGILVRTPLKAINTNKKIEDGDDQEQGCSATTPTSVEARINSERLLCPPAPRKRRPSLKFHSNNNAMDFFNPPELESIFVSNL